MLIFVGFDLPTFTARANLPSVFILMLSFSLASTAFVYCIEKAFDEPRFVPDVLKRPYHLP